MQGVAIEGWAGENTKSGTAHTVCSYHVTPSPALNSLLAVNQQHVSQSREFRERNVETHQLLNLAGE